MIFVPVAGTKNCFHALAVTFCLFLDFFPSFLFRVVPLAPFVSVPSLFHVLLVLRLQTPEKRGAVLSIR